VFVTRETGCNVVQLTVSSYNDWGIHGFVNDCYKMQSSVQLDGTNKGRGKVQPRTDHEVPEGE